MRRISLEEFVFDSLEEGAAIFESLVGASESSLNESLSFAFAFERVVFSIFFFNCEEVVVLVSRDEGVE